MQTTKTYLRALMLITLGFLIGGCTGVSQPTHFYTLTSTVSDQRLTEENGDTSKLAIGIGPLKLADYLTKSSIITRIDDNQIDQAEFDQWSGSLQNNVMNVLADNIGHLLGTEKVFIYPWRSFVPINYQVILEIVRFDGQLGNTVTLEARWYVIKDKSVIDIKRSNIAEVIDEPGFTGLVAAESKALEQLGLEIAQSILETSPK